MWGTETINQYLMINGTSFGKTKIKQSSFFRTDFQIEWNKTRDYFYEKYCDNIPKDISVITEDETMIFKGIIVGGTCKEDNCDYESISINRVSDIQYIKSFNILDGKLKN